MRRTSANDIRLVMIAIHNAGGRGNFVTRPRAIMPSVRVAGYSPTFKLVNRELQNQIIARTKRLNQPPMNKETRDEIVRGEEMETGQTVEAGT